MRQNIYPEAIGVLYHNKTMKDTQAVQHRAEKVPGEETLNSENEIARIEVAQFVPTSTKVRTPSYHRGEENNWLHIYHTCTLDSKLETGAKTEHSDQTKIRTQYSTAVRKEGVGLDGAKNNENGRTDDEKHGSNGKIERCSTAAHSERVVRRKPTPKVLKVKSGGHARVTLAGDVIARSTEPTCPALLRKPLDDVSSSPRSLSPATRPSPLKE